MHSPLQLALLTAAVLGFRHGFDYDHIAAITDIVGVQRSPRRAMELGMTYAIGHAVTVAALGSLVVFFGVHLPPSIDKWAEHLVGLTLILLGIYVLSSLALQGSAFTPKSRYTILRDTSLFFRRKLAYLSSHEHAHKPISPRDDGFKSVFIIGVVHGFGAETPSQLLIFLLAANLGGISRGLLGIGMFLAGLLAMNALMTALTAGLFGYSQRKPVFLRFVAAATAVYSLAMGVIFLFGKSAILPPLS